MPNNETLLSVTGSVTHDESDGLQVGGVATTTEDNNDNDVANLSALQTNAAALYDRLFTAGGLNLTPPASVNGGGQAVAQVLTVTGGAGVNDLKFTDATGDVLNGAQSGLFTLAGDEILLYTDTVNNNIVLGKVGTEVIFALALEELTTSNVLTGGKIWIVQFSPLDNGDVLSHDEAVDLTNKLFVTASSELLFGNFDDAPANQNAWTAVDNDSASSTDIQLLITGQNVIQQGAENESYGDSVNTRATSLGSNNQAVNPGEALRFDTVTGIQVPIGSKAADFTQSIAYGDHAEVTGLGVTLVQTTPSASVQTVQVSIWDVQADTAQGNTYVGGLDTSATGDANNDRVNIASVEIRNAANQTVEWRAVDGTLVGGTDVAGITFAFAESLNGTTAAINQATVAGLTVGMQIIVRSADGEVFDRMLVANVGTHAFDLGGIRILDASSDTDEVGSQVNFEDDGPAVTLGLNAVDPITVDETLLGISASDGGATLASAPDFGSDGDGGSSFSLDDPDAIDSGLVDVATGAAVLLDKDGDDVVGYIDGGGTTAYDDAADSEVFRISINSVTGELTLNQSRAIVHDDENDPDDTKSMGPGKVFASVLVTDGDGDTATDNVDISEVFAFKDDGPTATIAVNATPQLQTDDTTLASDDTETDPYATSPSDDGGADGSVDTVLTYSLVDVAAGTATGLFATIDGGAVVLDKVGDDLVGYVDKGGGTAFDVGTDLEVFRLSIDSETGQVTLDQQVAIKHDDGAEDSNDFQESDDATDGDDDTVLQQLTGPYIQVVATITDGDGDSFTTDPDFATLTVNFLDDGPTAPTVTPSGTANVTHDESEGVQADTDVAGNIDTGGVTIASRFAGLGAQAGDPDVGVKDTGGAIGFARSGAAIVDLSGGAFGADGPAGSSTTYSLGTAGGFSGARTTDGSDINVYAEGGLVVGRVGPADGPVAFAVAINSTTGEVYLAQFLSLLHSDNTQHDEAQLEPNDVAGLAAAAVQVSVTYTDGDNDQATSSPGDIGSLVRFEDAGPTITAPFDADPGTGGIQTPELLGNAVGQTASGTFGYDLGADGQAGGSDFVDIDAVLANVQIGLSGTVANEQNPGITGAVATRSAESATSATFDFSFHYDKDPITAGVQDATAGGTLVFDKVNDTYTFTLNDVIDGFSFDVLHTSGLLRKVPEGNTGHPPIVVTELDEDLAGPPVDGFYVQFTANTLSQPVPAFGFNGTGDGAPVAGDTAYNNGQFVTNVNEDWVSATQDTNGVAGDTIQKGELLTLRFFGENILSDAADNDPNTDGVQTIEKVDPTAKASGLVVKFDGIGASEDLIVILDLKDANGNETTRAINVQNADLIKGNANVPSPYNTEFTLDNNDALLIIEANDYNAAGETYQIQGLQIMQSANGLTGNAINLNGAVGAGGGSDATANLTAWDVTDNDVLKIVDIGFVQNTSGTLDADLDFAFTLSDGDNDLTVVQHLLVSISNDYIV